MSDYYTHPKPGPMITKTTVAAGQLHALSITPAVVLPRPGEGKLVKLVDVTLRYNFGGTAFTGTTDVTLGLRNDPDHFLVAGILTGEVTRVVNVPVGADSTLYAAADWEDEDFVVSMPAPALEGNGSLDVWAIAYIAG